MRYIKIELEGDTGNFAVLTRKRGSATIAVEVIKPSGNTAASHRSASPRSAGAFLVVDPRRQPLVHGYLDILGHVACEHLAVPAHFVPLLLSATP